VGNASDDLFRGLATGSTKHVENRSRGVLEVVVGVALTALLSGLLVPYVKGRLDRRSELFRSAVALVDTVAENL
jgi:hypothetical protein